MLGILVGLIGGTLSGLTGLGGGFIMVPLLVFFFGMTQHAAQGTSLAVLQTDELSGSTNPRRREPRSRSCCRRSA